MKFPLLLSAALFSLSLSAQAVSFREPSPAEIQEAVQTFHFRGQWIHPKIVKEFLPWESDYNLPLVTAIDISAATGTNRYFGEISLGGAEKKDPEIKEDDGGLFRYHHVGRLPNGLHLLLTTEAGGGTLVGVSLMAFRLHETRAKNGEGKSYRRLLLEVERSVVLGDRAIPTFDIHGNEVKVKLEFQTPRKPETLKLSFD